MNINKYYVVLKGRQTGIYFDWESCKKQVDGYHQAKYHSFKTIKECEEYINNDGRTNNVISMQKQESLNIKIDSKETTKRVNYDITLFTDGGNRNTGNTKGKVVKLTDSSAWAYDIVFKTGNSITKSQAYHGKTNNAMELSGLINGLSKLLNLGYTNKHIRVVSDSKYVLDAINKKWIYEWFNYGWTRKGKELKNAELWEELYNVMSYFNDITYDWTKGHTGGHSFESLGNAKVDALLNTAMDSLK